MTTFAPASPTEALPTWAAPVALAARADHATKRYGRGDNQVLALDDVTVGLPAAGTPMAANTRVSQQW